MKNAKLERFNFIFDSDFESFGGVHIYIPQPSDIEMKNLSRVLGYFYSSFQNNENPSVMLVDYERYIEEALEVVSDEAQRNRKMEQVKGYLERCLLGASIFDSEWSEIKKEELSDEDIEVFNGMTLFISALFRYSMGKGRKRLLGDYFTLSNVTEWIKQSKKSSKDTAQAKTDSQKKDTEQNAPTQQAQENAPDLFISVSQS